MQNFASVITSALTYYDNSINTYSKLLKYNRKLYYDNERKCYVVRFLNKKQEIVFASKCEIIGKYDLLNGYWLWAWADNSYESHISQYSKKILNYGLNLDNSKLRDHLINSKIFLNSNAQLDVHIALILYILKKQLIVPVSWTRKVDNVVMTNYNVYPIRLNFFVVPTELDIYQNNIKKIDIMKNKTENNNSTSSANENEDLNNNDIDETINTDDINLEDSNLNYSTNYTNKITEQEEV